MGDNRRNAFSRHSAFTESKCFNVGQNDRSGSTAERICQSKKTRRSSWFVILLTLLVVVQVATSAWAWGRLGHRVIARLSEKHVTPEAWAGVAALLESGKSMADSSLWEDEHRRELPKTAPWHHVDVRLDEPNYDPKGSPDDPKDECVIDKINEFPLVVMDESKAVRCSGPSDQADSRRLPKWDGASKNPGLAGVLFRAGDLGFEPSPEALRRYWSDVANALLCLRMRKNQRALTLN